MHIKLHAIGLAVTVLNPCRSRRFAQALGQLAKTDAIDASVLARFAAMIRPDKTVPPPKILMELRELIVARRQIIQEMTSLKLQLRQANHALIQRQMRSRLRSCDRHKQALDAGISRLIQTQTALCERFDILCSIPGIGPVCATTLIVEFSELGTLNAGEISAPAGVAPMNRDSGA